MTSKPLSCLVALTLVGCFSSKEGVQVGVRFTQSAEPTPDGDWLDADGTDWKVDHALLHVHSLTLTPCDTSQGFVTEYVGEPVTGGFAQTDHAGSHDANDFGELHVLQDLDLTATGELFSVALHPLATELCALSIALDDDTAFELDAAGSEGSLHTLTAGPLTITLPLQPHLTPTLRAPGGLQVDTALDTLLASLSSDDNASKALKAAMQVTVEADGAL